MAEESEKPLRFVSFAGTDRSKLEAMSEEEAEALLEVDDVPHFYSNTVQVQLGKWDMRLIFSETLPSSDVEISFVKRHATVVMSHQHAKAMLDVLQGIIERNAEKHGLSDIYFPPEKKKAKESSTGRRKSTEAEKK